MRITPYLYACIAGLAVGGAFAQVPPPPLDLHLPASSAPAAGGSVANPAQAVATQPGVYYGDTSGRMGERATARAPACDDSTYNNPQVHGSVGMGVMGGSHMNGNYQTGTVTVAKRYGSCEEPSGGASFSISVGTSHFGGRIR